VAWTTVASKPMPAMATTVRPSATARSTWRSCPLNPTARAASSPKGTPKACATRLAVPRGKIAREAPVPARACAQAPTVPSPPTAKTSRTPAATTQRESAATPSPQVPSSGVLSRKRGSQPLDAATSRHRFLSRFSLRVAARFMTNATDLVTTRLRASRSHAERCTTSSPTSCPGTRRPTECLPTARPTLTESSQVARLHVESEFAE